MVTVPVLLPDHHGREPNPWTSASQLTHTVPVLVLDHHGREPSPWTSGFPSRRRREERQLVRQLPCPLWSLPAPGFRLGAKDKARLSVSLASHLSPKDVPNLSGPSTAIRALPGGSYLPHPDPPCSGQCGCGQCPVCSPEPGFHIFWQHQSGTLN